MFGFGKKARQEKAKREVLAMGELAVDVFNDALARWRSSSLEGRRSILDSHFAEKLVILQPTDRLSFETITELEGLALMKNWLEGADQCRSELLGMIDPDILQCFVVMGIMSELDGHIFQNFQAVTEEIESDIDIAITEAVHRRGETSWRAGRRELAARCVSDYGYIETLTVAELLDEAKTTFASDSTFGCLLAFKRRFYGFALAEHGITEAERKSALTIAQSLESDIMATLEGNVEAQSAFIEAVEFEKEVWRKTGVGSLKWKMEAEAIPAQDVITYAARIENAEILPDYLSMLDPDIINQIKYMLLCAMVASRRRDNQSDLGIMLDMLGVNGPTLALLLSADELAVLQNASAEPDLAQQTVSNLLQMGQ